MSTLKAGVIGYPIHHSKSPIIHGHWIEEYDLTGTYETIEIAPENLKEDIQKLVDQGFHGFNATIPHKENIMALCDEVDETAKAIGAVNTILIKDRKLFGSNTDVFGFIQNIKQEVPHFDFKNKRAVVLGAGGAARAIVYAFKQEDVSEIIITNRTREKAESLIELAPDQVRVIDWESREDALKGADLLVNTTPLGMEGQLALELDLTQLPTHALVSDIVYTPLMTDLLSDAKAQGNDIVTGIGMLLHQARPAFEKWTGILPDVDDVLIKKVLS